MVGEERWVNKKRNKGENKNLILEKEKKGKM